MNLGPFTDHRFEGGGVEESRVENRRWKKIGVEGGAD